MPSKLTRDSAVASKKVRNFRFDDQTNEMLQELAKHLGLSHTAVLQLAVRRLYRTEFKRTKPEKSPDSGEDRS